MMCGCGAIDLGWAKECSYTISYNRVQLKTSSYMVQ